MQPLHCWQEQTDQDRDDRDNHEQLDEREAARARGFGCHGASPLRALKRKRRLLGISNASIWLSHSIRCRRRVSHGTIAIWHVHSSLQYVTAVALTGQPLGMA